MDLTAGADWIAIPLQIFVVDLLLGADNALLIALACRSLDPKDTRKAVILGTGGAIVLRLFLTVVATSLLSVPLVKLGGAWVLIIIALNVASDHRSGAYEQGGAAGQSAGLWSAVAAIIVADAAMSVDNVVALAAIARGNFWLLTAGVALSIPVLAYGGLILSSVLRSAPWLVALGAALLGWIAGDMAVSDPLIGGWISLNAPGLAAIAPALCAAFVFFNARAPTATRNVAAAQPPPKTPPAVTPRSVSAPRPATPVRPAPLRLLADEKPEPDDHAETSRRPMAHEDRAAVIGVLVLALIAGVVLMLVSYLDSVN